MNMYLPNIQTHLTLCEVEVYGTGPSYLPGVPIIPTTTISLSLSLSIYIYIYIYIYYYYSFFYCVSVHLLQYNVY